MVISVGIIHGKPQLEQAKPATRNASALGMSQVSSKRRASPIHKQSRQGPQAKAKVRLQPMHGLGNPKSMARGAINSKIAPSGETGSNRKTRPGLGLDFLDSNRRRQFHQRHAGRSAVDGEYGQIGNNKIHHTTAG